MADITMCTNLLCPKAKECYRVHAVASHWQSMTSFKYTVGVNGVECDNHIPRHKVTTANNTKTD